MIRTIWHLGILIFLPHSLIGLCDLFLSNLLSQGFLVYLTKKECIAVSSGSGSCCNESAPCIGGIQRFILSGTYRTNERCRTGFGGCCRRNQLSADEERENVCSGGQEKASSMWTGSDAAVSGHYQRASCPDNACPDVFLCAVGTGNRNLSVYPLLGIIYAASFILHEREKLAQLVS